MHTFSLLFATSCLVTIQTVISDDGCDWRPIFKVSAGATDQWFTPSTKNHLFTWWTDTTKSTLTDITLDELFSLSLNPSEKTTNNYKSLIINNWSTYINDCFDLIKVSVYDNNIESAYIIFDGYGSTNTDWFHRDNIISSSYTDLPNSHTCSLPPPPNFLVTNGCVFSIKGDVNTQAYRNFYINRNYGGCANDDGWLCISLFERCGNGWKPAEIADGQPTIHYTTNNKIGNFGTASQHTTGDTFVVSINGCCSITTEPTEEPTTEPRQV